MPYNRASTDINYRNFYPLLDIKTVMHIKYRIMVSTENIVVRLLQVVCCLVFAAFSVNAHALSCRQYDGWSLEDSRERVQYADVVLIARVTRVGTPFSISQWSESVPAVIEVERTFKGETAKVSHAYLASDAKVGDRLLIYGYTEKIVASVLLGYFPELFSSVLLPEKFPLLIRGDGDCGGRSESVDSPRGALHIAHLNTLARERVASNPNFSELAVAVSVETIVAELVENPNAALANTLVTITGNGQTFTTRADANGTAVFKKMPAGLYVLALPPRVHYDATCAGKGTSRCDSLSLVAGQITKIAARYVPTGRLNLQLDYAIPPKIPIGGVLAHFRLTRLESTKAVDKFDLPFLIAKKTVFAAFAATGNASAPLALQLQTVVPPGEYAIELLKASPKLQIGLHAEPSSGLADSAYVRVGASKRISVRAGENTINFKPESRPPVTMHFNVTLQRHATARSDVILGITRLTPNNQALPDELVDGEWGGYIKPRDDRINVMAGSTWLIEVRDYANKVLAHKVHEALRSETLILDVASQTMLLKKRNKVVTY